MPARLHEVPLPPPEKPEREHRRDPAYEQAAIGIGPASAWVADVHRDARELARRVRGPIQLEVELEDGRRVAVTALRAGPGATFVTFGTGEERELAVRLDRIATVELAPARGDARPFRTRERGVGFE
jgi:hypothetical protein